MTGFSGRTDAVLLSRSCTTGWADCHLGALWLRTDGLARVRLDRSGEKAAAETWMQRKTGARTTVRTAPLEKSSLGVHDIQALLREYRRNRWLPRTQIHTAKLREGFMCSRLTVLLDDGSRVRLLWLRRDPATAVLADVLRGWLGERLTHKRRWRGQRANGLGASADAIIAAASVANATVAPDVDPAPAVDPAPTEEAIVRPAIEADFTGGQRLIIKPDGVSDCWVITDARSDVVATLGHNPSVFAAARNVQWSIAVEPLRRSWGVVARDPSSGDAVGCCYPRWRPGVFDVWIAPDSWYRLQAGFIKTGWTLADEDGIGLARVPITSDREKYPDWLETTPEASRIRELPLLLLLSVQAVRLEPGWD